MPLDAATEVRLPRALEGYACRRSLGCCRVPYTAWMAAGEPARMTAQLARAGAADSLRRRLDEAMIPFGSDWFTLAQRGPDCALLDAEVPACALQQAAGLAALPLQCRNFPRSVVSTPTGVEVAFRLDCPSAAALVAAATTGAFVWARRDGADWPYPPGVEVPEVLAWSAERSIPYAEYEVLRTRWWERLAAGVDGSLLDTLGALVVSPGDPGAPAPAAIESEPYPAAAVLAVLAQQPHLSAWASEGAGAALSTALARPRAPAELTAAADTQPAAWAFAAALRLQRVALHDGRAVRDGLIAAAREVRLALVTFAALREATAAPVAAALTDAIAAATQVNAVMRSGTARLV